MTNELLSALICQSMPGIGPAGLTKLRVRFNSFSKALQAEPSGLPDPYRKALRAYRASPETYLGEAAHIVETCSADNIDIIVIGSESYPPLLAEIDSPPAIIYIKGETNLLGLPQLAIVGSRQHSAGGEKTAFAFARALAASGFTITSGMALGIDASAHRGAMLQGSTIAVLGTGIDVIYPRRNSEIYHDIINGGGAVVSEFPPGTPARAGHFPQRNRVISGLSLGVLVVEAAVRSGSLITARLAMEQGREVFAIPGSIHNPQSKGCHKLIRDGATLTETAQDIVAELGGMLSFVADKAASESTTAKLGAVESKVLTDVGFDYIDLDTLVARCQISVAELIAILTQLELAGCIENRGGLYSRLS